MTTKFAMALFGFLVLAQPVSAQMMPQGSMPMPMEHMSKQGKMMHPSSPMTDAALLANENATPSTRAYMAAHAKMHAAMMVTYSGKPSLDFVNAMIPHHRGAIEMAQVALLYSTDKQTRALARKIIAAQEAEIREMTSISRRLSR